MPFRVGHCGDIHLDEDRYFGDTARCLEWFVADSISSGTDLFVINGDLTNYKATTRETESLDRPAHQHGQPCSGHPRRG